MPQSKMCSEVPVISSYAYNPIHPRTGHTPAITIFNIAVKNLYNCIDTAVSFVRNFSSKNIFVRAGSWKIHNWPARNSAGELQAPGFDPHASVPGRMPDGIRKNASYFPTITES